MEYYFQKVKNIYHLFTAVIASGYYGNPSKHLKVIGVTGTDGKTTTTALIYHILKSSGKSVSMISTVSAVVGNKSYDTGFHVTTPSPFSVQKFIKRAVEQGNEFFVLETTSHSLDQFRVYGIRFVLGLITNITHEHLLYHKTYANYVAAKVKLIRWSAKGIINRDDISYKYIIGLLNGSIVNDKIITYGLQNEADYDQDIELKIGQKLAHFNKYNYLAAYAVCRELEISEARIFEAMKTFVLPPGRMEVVFNKDFMVIIDFAHTPNAIYEALRSLKEAYPKRRVLHIFGAAAFRDDSKRPLMGEASAHYADATIITEEDYRTEDPEKIGKQIGQGLLKGGFRYVEPSSFLAEEKTYTSIVNRKDAIDKAISVIKKGDIIILTGKGHEQSLCRGNKEYPWDDKKAVLASIATL